MRLLVLYEELAGYFVNCLNALAQTQNAQLLVVAKQVNAVAPFEFKGLHPSITLLFREQLTQEELARRCLDFSPDMVYLGGWAFKPYLRLIKQLARPKTVIGFDNQYTGSLKQRLGSLYFRFSLKPHVRFAFVPGPRQVRFAEALGFKAGDVATGAYCCDLGLFDKFRAGFAEKKAVSFPKRFLFVGRYAPEKGIALLWQCFTELQQESPNDWELWCAGKGDLAPQVHPKIRHLGFVQPEDLGPIIEQTGVFVLPSRFEPWGVVLQEFAAAGFPLLSTERVGATDTFLANGKNGLLIESDNKSQLKNALHEFMHMNDKTLNLMAENSAAIAHRITPQIWVENLMKWYAN